MTEFRLNDTIVFLKQNEEPLLGSISFKKPASPHSIITINGIGKTVHVPLNQIKLALFKLSSQVWGMIWKNKMYFDLDKSEFNYWNETTSKIASHELKTNSIPLERR